MLSQRSLSGGIAPQFLSQPNLDQGITVMSQLMPSAIKNVYSDPNTHLNVLYSNYETPYMSNINCSTGAVSVNNECICPGAPGAVPFKQAVPVYSKNYLNTLWSPIESNLFPQVSPASQMLIASRSPCGTNGSASCNTMYGNLDTMPLNQTCGTGCY